MIGRILGNEVLNLLDNDLVKSNEFYQISLLSLFSRNIKLNNLDKLLKIYNSSSNSIKRKISLTAYSSNCSSWFKEHKEEYAMMDSWNKRAMIIGSKLLQPDEREILF